MSGHVFELIEYFYYFHFYHSVDAVILVPFEISEQAFFDCLEKYTFTEAEINIIRQRTIFNTDVKLLYCRNILFTDGAINDVPVLSKNIIFLRCKESNDLDKADIVLQDNRLYNELKNSTHYVKKILMDKFIEIDECEDNVLIYGTTNCRSLTYDELKALDEKYHYNQYILVSNKIQCVPDRFKCEIAPLKNLFSKFNVYIYTQLHQFLDHEPFDCSPRFPVECAYYHKKVIYDTPIVKGLDVRIYDIKNNFESLFLRKSDKIIEYLI